MSILKDYLNPVPPANIPNLIFLGSGFLACLTANIPSIPRIGSAFPRVFSAKNTVLTDIVR